MSDERTSAEKKPQPAAEKKPYKAPSLRFESVFEVSALACGKLTSTQSGCHFSTKSS